MIEAVDGNNRMDGKEVNVDQVVRQNLVMAKKIRALQAEKNELTSSLMQLTPLLKQMQETIEKQRQELRNRGKMDTKSIPCFKCDGRKTEKHDSSKVCGRCKGTGLVNT